ncbi:sarcosine oxidase subunit gamma [Pseudogemmobacter bohemicus]|uniref:sarcosine oxidase subunit gamma n=1 Tax=Pseudogemmobacter bohemicus TaxID=2250708 RepID=UPI0013003F1F|nr:sarcosine oxidase subunit gamma [Pseudogemmobacter bohemicus]
MAELIAKTALDGQRPATGAGLVLATLPPGPVWSIAPFPGVDLAPVLAPLGLAFPTPGQSSSAGDLRLIWTGRDQAFLLGGAAPPGLEAFAAVTDQTGAWAGFSLSGEGGEAALARLVTPDLRLAAFPVGHVIRTALNHIPAIILREGRAGFHIRVFRSMARSAWHELAAVLERLAARQAAEQARPVPTAPVG